MSFRIESLWAWTSIDRDDEEGVVAVMRNGLWMPLIAADRVRLDLLRPDVELIARQSRKVLTLRRFEASGVPYETLEIQERYGPDEPCAHPRALRVFHPDGSEFCPVCLTTVRGATR